MYFTENLCSRYEGSFNNCRFHGKGKMTCWDGKIYEGQFCDGKMVGKATISHPGKYVFEGEVENFTAQGNGTQTVFKLNLRYEGQFEHGKYHGHGRLINTTDGQVFYSGRFTNGEMDPSPMASELASEDSNDKL